MEAISFKLRPVRQGNEAGNFVKMVLPNGRDDSAFIVADWNGRSLGGSDL